MKAEEIPEVNPDRCIGCGTCATGCPENAIRLEEKPGVPEPPLDRKALKEAVTAAKSGSK
ncbi:MAG: 4Fe-4S binding protein [bacterium]